MTLLAAMLSLALAPEPAPPSDEAPTIALELDLSALPDDDVTKGLEQYLRGYQTEVIQDVGLEISDDASLVIRIEITRYGDGDIHSRADIALIEVGSYTPRQEHTVECQLCRDGDLVVKVGDKVGLLSEWVLYPTEEEEEPEAEPVETTDEVPTARDGPRPPSEDIATPPPEPARAIGPLGYSGVAALVVGTVALATGTPLVLQPDEVRLSSTRVEIRSTRNTGVVLAFTGGTILTVGAVLLTIDAFKPRKRRRVSILPGPTVSGVSVRGTF